VGTPSGQQPCHRVLVARVYGFVISDEHLYVGKVISIYSQGRGKLGAHGWQQSSTNIGAISYLSMQLYEQSYSATFQAVHTRLALLQAFTYKHLMPDSFLCLMPGSSVPDSNNCHLQLDNIALTTYNNLNKHSRSLGIAVQDLQKLRHRGKHSAQDQDNAADDKGLQDGL
ncbi:hypothetical protein HETIRDRAFT_328623, partial [Heterobasidion irregulare TC 32-1]